MPTLHVNELRRNVGEALDRVGRGERLTITRFNRPIAGLVTIEDLERLENGVSEEQAEYRIPNKNDARRRNYPARALADIVAQWTEGDLLLAAQLLTDALALTIAKARIKPVEDHK